MPKLIDLTGKKFGHLTVIKRAINANNGHAQWECQCDCGNAKTVITTGDHLRSGHTTSCGCVQKQFARNLNFIDIVGQQFGNLKVIKEFGSDKKGQSLWECECVCGTKTIVRGSDLRGGHTQSCGCIYSRGEKTIKEILNNNNINFISQKVFDTCKFPDTNAYAKFDFFIDNKYLIEYDGIQHFNIINNGWKQDFKEIKYKDNFKNNWCKENHIPLIRIPYTHYDNLCLEDLLLETTKYRVI